MPTRKRAAASPADDVIENGGDSRLPVKAAGTELVESDHDEELDIAEQIRQAVSTGERVYVRVFKKTPDGWAVCRDYPADEVITGDLSVIRDSFGPGLYELRITGKSGYLGRPKVEIAPSLVPSPLANPAQSETAQLLKAVLEGQQLMMQRLAAPVAPPSPPFTFMQQLGVTSLAEGLALVGSVKALLAPATPPAAPSAPQSFAQQAKEMADAMKTFKDIANENADPAGDPDNPMSLIPGFLEVLKTGMQQQGGAAAAAGLPTLALPSSVASAHETVPALASTHQPESGDEMQFIMNRVLGMLAAKETPEAIGNYLYEYLPDEAFALFNMPNWLDALISTAPPFANYRAELTAAHAQIVKRQGAT